MGKKFTFKVWQFDHHSYPIEVFFAPTEKDWRGLLIDKGIITEDNDEPYPTIQSGAQVTSFNLKQAPGRLSVITVGPKAEEHTAEQVMGTLVHELTHVKQNMEEAAYGQNQGGFSSRFDIETEAYLMQAMIMWLSHAYAASGRKFKGGE